jgi:DNA-binding NarL/FixJ family response regulator
MASGDTTALPPPSYPDGLTPREVEVLGLLAAGLSNREIADTLVVSVRTVGRHIDNIYGKIGVHERSKARQYARDHGLATRFEPAG